jgi:hypothetical protein
VLRRISNINGVLVSKNEISHLFFKYNELAGHKYVVVSFTGNYKIESNRRCTILLRGKHDDFSVLSDTDYIEGVYSEKSEIGLTKFDFNLNQSIIDFINSNTIEEVDLIFENGLANHDILTIRYNEIDQPSIINELGSLD